MNTMRWFLLSLVLCATPVFSQGAGESCPAFISHKVTKLHSSDVVSLCERFSGRPLLVINTASHCGFTPQFKGLEKLHQVYGDQGLAVLGVPSNDFRQAADSEEKAAEVCYVNYGVTFLMTSQQKVKGDDAHPLFRHLAEKSGSPPQWNFNKYLVSADGETVLHFPSSVKPDDPALTDAIEEMLASGP
jgi:glutathione peroxidase